VPGALHWSRTGSVVSAVADLEGDVDLDSLRGLQGAHLELFPLDLEQIFLELVGPEVSV
jgi:hypothetical protein